MSVTRFLKRFKAEKNVKPATIVQEKPVEEVRNVSFFDLSGLEEDVFIDEVEDLLSEDEPEEAILDMDILLTYTKQELETYAKTFGIDLDRRRTKENMIRDFLEQIKQIGEKNNG
jgi:excinuclease UvrABC nuclease subunit